MPLEIDLRYLRPVDRWLLAGVVVFLLTFVGLEIVIWRAGDRDLASVPLFLVATLVIVSLLAMVVYIVIYPPLNSACRLLGQGDTRGALARFRDCLCDCIARDITLRWRGRSVFVACIKGIEEIYRRHGIECDLQPFYKLREAAQGRNPVYLRDVMERGASIVTGVQPDEELRRTSRDPIFEMAAASVTGAPPDQHFGALMREVLSIRQGWNPTAELPTHLPRIPRGRPNESLPEAMEKIKQYLIRLEVEAMIDHLPRIPLEGESR